MVRYEFLLKLYLFGIILVQLLIFQSIFVDLQIFVNFVRFSDT